MTYAQSASHRSELLADPTDTRANCGVGVVMDLDGTRTHTTIADGLELLANLEHRGTTGAEENTGDGAGIMFQTPRDFFSDILPELPDEYAIGSIFLPKNETHAQNLKSIIETTFESYGLTVQHWRTVPTDNTDLGKTAIDSEPEVVQCFVTQEPGVDLSFDRSLYVGRRAFENKIHEESPPGSDRCYICSLDRDIVVYKGLLKGTQLPEYYEDLNDERVKSTFALVHARFSTNTLGAWHLAHPYRRIIHNGEFNTIQGNINWMRARETEFEHEEFGDALDEVKPVIRDPEQSDTASVDNALELLLNAGRELPHALRMLIPEAWRGAENNVNEERKAWYDYHASLVEPWDGPALVIGTDGTRIAGVLDRNGLRPCRYERTTDNRLIMASEAGALETPIEEVVERGRLQPGQLFLADPDTGRVIPDDEIFQDLTDEQYEEWIENEQVQLPDDLRTEFIPERRDGQLRQDQVTFGYTHDELDNLLEPMATEGKDPVGSMGDDTPLSVLSDFNRPLSSYFKQLFAQVSNPPVDNIREELVFSLETRLGFQRNLLTETPAHARQLVIDSPILTDAQMDAIKSLDENGMSTGIVDITYDGTDLASAIERVREETETVIDAGHDIVVLSDRNVGPDRVPIPSLLATGAVHHYLVRNGKRNRAGLVIESGDPRTVHQIATLVGYGAGAINPYLAYQTIADLVDGPDGADPQQSISAYAGALEDGLLKVMSKMGISTVESYQGAQIFEAVGLNTAFVNEYFEGTENRTNGIGIEEIEVDLLERHDIGYGDDPELQRQGEFEHRSAGIRHQWNPQTVGTLQRAVRSGDYEKYKEFATLINDQHEELQTLRGLLDFSSDRDPIPIEDVEPIHEVVKRFSTGSMSLGSLSPEAHENLSMAMDRLGAKSGSGEGGEPPERFGTPKETHIKQVASGRFGVTSNYLTNAEVIQIKMAQGSKPGEGGHLPGHKVNEMIAHVRRSVPGVGLISPPPQHDIYSIEDLKQLIHDLKAANPAAEINVKLVAEAGVGIIAAGVAKANADQVLISGDAGGTGASPKTSIKNAGVPWELGLAEANQMLMMTGLRDRIKVSTDGGLKTGRDAAIAALLGAEEFIYGTAGLVSEGCVMARQCHRNTCPVGVATQREELRERFPGQPEQVINYMTFMAQELREIMAELGFRTVDEMVGHVDVLEQRDDVTHPKARKVELSAMLTDPETPYEVDRMKTKEQTHDLDSQLDWELIEDSKAAINAKEPVVLTKAIGNVHRAVGATLSNKISRKYGEVGLPDDTIHVDFAGAAGQSFGAFLQTGVTFDLSGVANDYFGKGLSGGRLIAQNPPGAMFDPTENTLIGNVALYGGTEGEAYINGIAGERFAVRNSGVRAVVEGVGDHGCEYMTSGLVVVLGDTGKNFAAGMSGGIAYVYDPNGTFERRCNLDMVRLSRELEDNDAHAIHRLVQNHAAYTESDRANELLANWEEAQQSFVKVMPDAYQQAIKERPDADARRSLPSSPVAPDHPVSESAD